MTVSTDKITLGNLGYNLIVSPFVVARSDLEEFLFPWSVIKVHHIWRKGYTTISTGIVFQSTKMSNHTLASFVVAGKSCFFVFVVVLLSGTSMASFATTGSVFFSTRMFEVEFVERFCNLAF